MGSKKSWRKTAAKPVAKQQQHQACGACSLDKLKCNGNGKSSCSQCCTTMQLCSYAPQHEYFSQLLKLNMLRDTIFSAPIVAVNQLPLFGSLLPVLGYNSIVIVKQSFFDYDENFENPRHCKNLAGKAIHFPEIALAMDENPAAGVT
eukprot:631478-Rhodomonas_salina.1